MYSMCHHCGADLTKCKEENGIALHFNNGGPLWSCKVCLEKHGVRQPLIQDGTSPSYTPTISPTTSLSSSDRSYSGSSDFSVDINSCDRRDQEEGTVDHNHESPNNKPNSRWQNSSQGSMNRVGEPNSVAENSLKDGRISNYMDVVRDVEIVESSNDQEAKDVENVTRSSDKEAGISQSSDSEMDCHIWDPPEPEDPEDDLEHTVAYDDDEDDDREWNKSSSLSHMKDESSGRFKFKEEKRKAMEEIMNGKFKAVVSQLFKSMGIASSVKDGESWVDIVTSLSWEAASFLKPDSNDAKTLDLDGYVKVKCIATGSRGQSQLIKGLVFKKHAAHKHMPTHYKNPRLLLIQGMSGHSSSGLLSLDSVDQEKGHLKTLIEMIDVLHPNVILVEKTVSRDVQELILAKGVTLVFDMKLHRLERVARCTGLQIISPETLMNQKLKPTDLCKQCDSFHIEKFIEEHAALGEGGKRPSKTLMFLEGLPTHLGCTILLKGSHSDELKRIKSLVQYTVIRAYHLILETSFLFDQRAMFSTIPFAQVADSVPIFQQSHALEIANLSSSVDEPTEAVAEPYTIDIPISNGYHDCDLHLTANVEGEKIGNGVLDYSSAISSEPYNPAILSRLSSLSASIKKVMGKNLPIASAAPYDSLYSYFGFNGRDSIDQITETVPVLETSEVSNHCDVEANGNCNEEKCVADGQASLSASHEDPVKDIDNLYNDDKMQSKEDINTVLDSQSILVLMSSRNALRGTICEQIHFSHIVFYRNFDVPLGKFLRDNLLNQRRQCGTCGELPEAHFYYYVHHNTQLTIQVKRLPNEKPLPGEADGRLWMWSRCVKCKTGNGISKSTKRVLISNAACGLSFGKFLELCFSENSSSSRLASCGHSMLYFFGLGPMVAMFKYSSVASYTVSLPPQKLEFNNSIRSDWLKEECEKVYSNGMLFFREVGSYLSKIRSQLTGSTLNLKGSLKEFSDVEEILKLETSEFEAKILNIAAKNGSPNQESYKLLSLNWIRWELLLESCIWDRRIHSLILPDPTVVIAGSTKKTVQEKLKLEMDSPAAVGNLMTSTNPLNGEEGSNDMGSVKGNFVTSSVGHEFQYDEMEVKKPDQVSERCNGVHDTSTVAEDIEKPKDNAVLLQHADDNNSEAEKVPISNHLDVVRTIPISTDLDSIDCAVDLNESRNGGSPCPLLSCLENSNGWFWMPFSEIRKIYMKDLQRGFVPKFECVSNYQEHMPTGYQLINEEGSRLHIPVGDDSIVSDFDGELSSIIACALALLKDISNVDNKKEKIVESAHGLIRIPTSTSHRSFSSSLDSDSVHSTQSSSSEKPHFSSFDGLSLLDSLVPPEAFNQEVSLGANRSLGKGKYSVICLYANEFRDLRNRCCHSELDFISSLCRCKNWDAKGGKSKSFFAKTIDDRFIIKEIKRTECDSFQMFAPHYFEHMNKSFKSGNQTCLAKVLGIYQVIIRQTKSGKELKHDLMVMENLTFGRNISRQYDLKGALHARFNSAADGSRDVLLDQNFVNDMNSSPLYVSNRAKRLLQRAVFNDTTFLNTINVMDYSLLVGVDSQRRELVCGIIDYLRQYTWDKQLETWVKSSLVVPKNVLPTVISPKEYKKRFRKFMSTYFLSLPDQWCTPGSTDPCQLCRTGGDDLSLSKPENKDVDMNGSPA
ncbi:hypothetical protein SLE2022_328620 [Rubroshorea leprosula]